MAFSMHQRRVVLASALAVTLAATPPNAFAAKRPHKHHRASTAQACDNADLNPTPANLDQVGDATLCLLNAERTKRGLRSLKAERSLTSAASKYANQMVEQSFFDHVSPGGSTMVQRIKRTSYLKGATSWALGENLAWGTGSYATPQQTVKAWMNSAGHRRNILDRSFREIGIGVAHGAPVDVSGQSTAATYATEFGLRDR